MTTTIVAGIDVAKETLELAIGSNAKTLTVANSRRGFTTLIKRCTRAGVELVIIEPTGGYERDVIEAMQEAGLPVVLADASRVKSFTRYKGVKAKTDGIDARMLAAFGEETKELRLLPKLSPKQIELRHLVHRRCQLVQDKNRELLRKEKAPRELVSMIKEHIAFMTSQIKALDKAIAELIESCETLSAKADQLKSICGIADITAANLLAFLPELGTLKRQQITALAGLAPWAKDSGNYEGKRSIGGGRRAVRNALYMPARVAAQHSPVIREVYQRLTAKGKPDKCALVACMRKMLHIANALLRDGVHFDAAVAAAE